MKTNEHELLLEMGEMYRRVNQYVNKVLFSV